MVDLVLNPPSSDFSIHPNINVDDKVIAFNIIHDILNMVIRPSCNIIHNVDESNIHKFTMLMITTPRCKVNPIIITRPARLSSVHPRYTARYCRSSRNRIIGDVAKADVRR
jgi:hypothetical protein